MQESIQRITKAKRDRNMAEVVEHLLSKLKALNSNPNTPTPQKKPHENKITVTTFNSDKKVLQC
jgi:hypothetical protein